MARFANDVKAKATTNKNVANKKVINHQGGESYTLGAKKELATFLLSSFMNGAAYEGQSAQHDRLVKLIGEVNPTFAAKAAIYARDQFGMRTVTHVVGARLPQLVKGEPWMKNFVGNLIVRPDDASEMIAYHKSKIGGPIPNSLKKGVQIGLSKFNAYQLDKWNKGNFNLIDTINLVTGGRNGKFRGNVISPVANELVKGSIASAETWESAVSAAGQVDDDGTAKNEAWEEIVLSGKIGQMALLKNLRNILQAAAKLNPKRGTSLVNTAAILLSTETRVVNSRIFPFRYLTAHQELKNASDVETGHRNIILKALADAIEIAVIANVPNLPGRTLIAIDISGSMIGTQVGGDRSVRRTADEVAGQLAGMYFKANPDDTDLLYFESSAKWGKAVNPHDSALTVIENVSKQISGGGGTYFESIFNLISRDKKVYDRIIILSDMQGAHSITKVVSDYRKSFNPELFVHSVDLVGYGTSMFNADGKLATYAGFSEKMFTLMAQAEQDPNILVSMIEAVEFDTI
jgi:hypothetical protein